MSDSSVRVHLITGFLGTGKTTTILHLLKHKPANEKWAVLVNEFGEVGVDGTILKSLGDGVAVREVPGGCLCCVSGLPFQIGMNSLIARERPDVLLIEPTGLGHPKQILDILRQDGYADVLHTGATVTLVDPRHLSQSRYREHDIYQDQLAVADVLVANKTDLCSDEDMAAFATLAESLKASKPDLQTSQIVNGELDTALLSVTDSASVETSSGTASLPPVLDLTQPLTLKNDESYRALHQQADGFFAVGWLITDRWRFSASKVRDWLYGLDVERAKAVLATDEGVLAFNFREGALSEQYLGQADAIAWENRLELIDLKALDEASLLQAWQACVGTGSQSPAS